MFVQLGAFEHRVNAEMLRAQVAGADIRSASVSSALDNEGGRLYRVRVGPLDSEQEVNRVLTKLRRAGISPYRLVTD